VTAAPDTVPDASTARATRRRWPSGVGVLTTRDGVGYRGATVTAFAFVSVDPPLVLACLDRTGRMADLVPGVGAFAVSVLDRSHEVLADRFAGRGPLVDADFGGAPYRLSAAGNPLLHGALAWVDSVVHAIHDGGDHVIVVGRVVESGVGADSDDPLLFYEGRYRRIEGE